MELPPNLNFLDVERNAMRGDPFDAILALSDLSQLHLSSNAFSGDIPTELGELASLQELWMANNQFGGATIPSQLGNLADLGKQVDTYGNFTCGLLFTLLTTVAYPPYPRNSFYLQCSNGWQSPL